MVLPEILNVVILLITVLLHEQVLGIASGGYVCRESKVGIGIGSTEGGDGAVSKRCHRDEVALRPHHTAH